MPQPTPDVWPAPDVHSHPVALTAATFAPTPIVDEFYNAVKKAPHPNTIISKVALDWWKNRKLQIKKKAEEREKVELELQKMRDNAAQLVELNANL